MKERLEVDFFRLEHEDHKNLDLRSFLLQKTNEPSSQPVSPSTFYRARANNEAA
jgi:hypothetical protein